MIEEDERRAFEVTPSESPEPAERKRRNAVQQAALDAHGLVTSPDLPLPFKVNDQRGRILVPETQVEGVVATFHHCGRLLTRRLSDEPATPTQLDSYVRWTLDLNPAFD